MIVVPLCLLWELLIKFHLAKSGFILTYLNVQHNFPFHAKGIHVEIEYAAEMWTQFLQFYLHTGTVYKLLGNTRKLCDILR